MSPEGTCDIVDAVARGDVLERHLQFRDALAERLQHGFEEHLLAVKDVDMPVGDLAVDCTAAEPISAIFSRTAVTLVRSRTPEAEFGGGARRVKLDRMDQPCGMGGGDIGPRVRRLCQVRGSSRARSFMPSGQGGHDPVAVGGGVIAGQRRAARGWGMMIRAAEMARGLWQDPPGAWHHRAGAGASSFGAADREGVGSLGQPGTRFGGHPCKGQIGEGRRDGSGSHGVRAALRAETGRFPPVFARGVGLR